MDALEISREIRDIIARNGDELNEDQYHMMSGCVFYHISEYEQRIAELEAALQYIARESAMARTGEKPIDICIGSIGFTARQALNREEG